MCPMLQSIQAKHNQFDKLAPQSRSDQYPKTIEKGKGDLTHRLYLLSAPLLSRTLSLVYQVSNTTKQVVGEWISS